MSQYIQSTQCKGRVLNTKFVPETVWCFSLVVPGRVQNVKNCSTLGKFMALRADNCANGPFLNINCVTDGTLCASKGMDLGPKFVGFALPS